MYSEDFMVKLRTLKVRARLSDDPRIAALAPILDTQVNRIHEQHNYLLSIMAQVDQRAPSLDELKEVVRLYV